MEQLNIHATRSEDTYKNRLTVALKAARTCVFEVDLAHQLYTFFENAEDIFGISGEEILAHVQPYSKLSPEEYQRAVSAYFSHPDDAAVIAEAFDRIFSGQQTTYEARMKAGDSEFVWCKLDVVPILENGHPVRMIGVITDISEARKKKELLEQRANLDGFTGLWNKRYAISAIGSVLEQEPDGRHALLVMDVDDFKYFNDTYGHAEGDRLLLALSDRLTATFHEDSIVGWFGGDEFIVFIRNIQNEGELERLHREIECIARVEYEGLSIAISVGAAFCPVDGTSFEALFAQADRMLYREKSIKGHRGLYQESPEPRALGMGEASPIPIPLCATQKNNQEGSGLADGSHQI